MRFRVLEPLERRRLLSSIAGMFYGDKNYNGYRDLSETALVGQTVYIDSNDNHAPDAGEPTSLVNTNGYSFQNLAEGSYTLRAVPPIDTAMYEGGSGQTIALGASENRSGVNFGAQGPLASGTIGGYGYTDYNQNGVFDTGDEAGGRGGAFLDLNNNGVLEYPTEPRVNSDSAGNFYFSNLAAGTYTVRFIANSGYRVTSPAAQKFTITLGIGTGKFAGGFGVLKAAQSIRGSLFNDANQNGIKDTGELGTSIGSVYIDSNNDGQRQDDEPLAANIDAFYQFSGLPNGTYTLRSIAGTGWTSTNPVAQVTTPGVATVVTQDFGFYQPATPAGYVQGNVFKDADNDGVKDTGEGGLQSVKVYLDLNNNTAADSGEPSTVSDSSGNYTIRAAVGSYTVRAVMPSGSTQTYPAGNGGYAVTIVENAFQTGRNFGVAGPATGAALSGVMWDDLDADGVRDTGEPGLAGYFVYLDTNNNQMPDTGEQQRMTDANGNYAFGTLAAGTYTLRQNLPSKYRQSFPTNTAPHAITINSGPVVAHFGNTKADLGGSISGVAYFDGDSDGVRDSGEEGIQYISVYEDTDNDGKRDWDEQFSVTDANGNYKLHDLPAGTYRIRADFFPDTAETVPAAAGWSVVVGNKQAVTGKNFGARPPLVPGSIKGTVFNDTDGDGVKDAGEVGLANWFVFIDYNDDGNTGGDYGTSTDASGNYTLVPTRGSYHVTLQQKSGWKLVKPTSGDYLVQLGNGQHVTGYDFANKPTSPPPPPPPPPTGASISGWVFNDGNKNGALDDGESLLASRKIYIDANANGKFDSGEKSVLSNASGQYTFSNLAAGAYRVGRADLPGGYYISAPAGGFWNITLSSGQVVTNKNIGAATGTTPGGGTTGSISGTVFSDLDKDGVLDGTDTRLASRKMYIDVNKNGKLDAGEKFVYSNAAGLFSFGGLSAGTYRIRRADMPGGYYFTTPASRYVDIVLSAGQVVSGKNFGAAPK